MILIPVILVILVGAAYLFGKTFISLVWIYFVIAAGSAALLVLLFFIGMLDLGSDGVIGDGGVGDGVGDGGAVGGESVGVHHDGGGSHASSLMFISPSGFLIITSLFGSFGIISYYAFSFLAPSIRDFFSIISAAALSLVSYIYVVKTVFKFLKTTSMTKSYTYYEGKEAEVLYDIPEDGFGKINIKTEDKYEQLLAKSEDGSRIPAGTIVRVKKYTGSFAIVER
ncbi:MAG: NfeD family protein, partial [Sulfurihydrogenibium azorense]